MSSIEEQNPSRPPTNPPSTPASPDTPPRTLDEYLAVELPTLTKRERKRLATRGGITVNGRTVEDVATEVGPSDVITLPPPPGGTRWAETPARPPKEAAPKAPPTPAKREPARTRMDRVASPPPSPSAPRFTPAPNTAPPARVTHAVQEPTGPFPERARVRDAATGQRKKRFLARGIRLVYEDDELLVIDKGAGIVTADPSHKVADTVFEAIKKYMRMGGRVGGRGKGRTGRVWVIHRLDKESSGLLVFAKTAEAFEAMKEQFRAKRTERLYSAVVEGVVGPPGHTGTHQSFLIDGNEHELRVKSIPAAEFRGVAGKEARLAVTHYKVIASSETVLAGTGGSLVMVRLETGRKNQIRVHMADLGHPIVGDRRYSAVSDPLERVCLHATELGFTHPRTGRPMHFSSPAPATFYRMVGATPPREDAPEMPTSGLPAVRPSGPVGVSGVDTSWDRVAQWYDDLISEKRNDHYEDVIMPGTLRLIEPREGMRLLDVACGQGVLSRRLSTQGVRVLGVDASPQLIAAAKQRGTETGRGEPPEYRVHDARDLKSLGVTGADAAACVMALGNIEPLMPVFQGVAAALRMGGAFVFVVAHPSFRAPGQTAWGWDAGKQYRRVEGYLSAGQKSIQMHPGKDASVVTWTFHRPLQTYSKVLNETGFVIERIEEWPGKRVSTSGPRAMEENRIRREIPLFLAIRAIKFR